MSTFSIHLNDRGCHFPKLHLLALGLELPANDSNIRHIGHEVDGREEAGLADTASGSTDMRSNSWNFKLLEFMEFSVARILFCSKASAAAHSALILRNPPYILPSFCTILLMRIHSDIQICKETNEQNSYF